MEAKQIEIKTLCISLAVLLPLEAAAKVVISKSLMAPIIALGIVRLSEAVLFVIVIMVWGNGLSSIGLAGHQIFPGIKKGFIWSVVFGVAVACISGVLYLADINPLAFIKAQLPGRSAELISIYFVGCVLAPITEEIFFRGILYGFLRRWGVAAAVSISTLLFVLPHLAGIAFPFTQLAGGVLFAAAYEAEGKLAVPITIHVLGNISIMTLSVL